MVKIPEFRKNPQDWENCNNGLNSNFELK